MVEARRIGKRDGRGVKDKRTALNESINGTDRAEMHVKEAGNETDGTDTLSQRCTTKRKRKWTEQNYQAKGARRGVKTKSEWKQPTNSAQRNGKTGKNGQETNKQRAGRWESTMLSDHCNNLNQTK